VSDTNFRTYANSVATNLVKTYGIYVRVRTRNAAVYPVNIRKNIVYPFIQKQKTSTYIFSVFFLYVKKIQITRRVVSSDCHFDNNIVTNTHLFSLIYIYRSHQFYQLTRSKVFNVSKQIGNNWKEYFTRSYFFNT